MEHGRGTHLPEPYAPVVQVQPQTWDYVEEKWDRSCGGIESREKFTPTEIRSSQELSSIKLFRIKIAKAS